METLSFSKILRKFISQSQAGDLKTASYPKIWNDMTLRVSFGMGAPARIPWVAFVAPEMAVSNGFYPCYLFYKAQGALILAYGVSETQEFGSTWPADIMNSAPTIESYFDTKVARYGDSFVFKTYKVGQNGELANDSGAAVSDVDLDSDLDTILNYYNQAIGHSVAIETSPVSQGVFYMEKQLEDFLIENWDNTELGKKYDLIVEDGDLVSQQYRTDVGPIDILAKEKRTGAFVVIELKKNQTSDDTVGQVARYMGSITKNKANGVPVKGVIIAARYDQRLEYALSAIQNIEVYLYEVGFKLKEFGR